MVGDVVQCRWSWVVLLEVVWAEMGNVTRVEQKGGVVNYGVIKAERAEVPFVVGGVETAIRGQHSDAQNETVVRWWRNSNII